MLYPYNTSNLKGQWHILVEIQRLTPNDVFFDVFFFCHDIGVVLHGVEASM